MQLQRMLVSEVPFETDVFNGDVQRIALHSAKLYFVSVLQSLSHVQKLGQFRKIHWQPG